MLRVRIGGARRPDRPAPAARVRRRARSSPARWTPTGYARYADRWVDFVNGLVIAAVTAIARAEPAGRRACCSAVMVASALASTLGRPVAGGRRPRRPRPRGPVRPLAGLGARLRAHGQAGRADPERARPPARRSTRGRVDAAVREHRVQALLDGVPDRDGAVRRRGGLGGPPRRRLGPGDRAAGGRRGQRLRLVRPGGRRGRHRGAGHACVACRRPAGSPAAAT